MNTTGTLNSKAKDLAADALHRLGYDATADKARRQAPTSRLMAEDKHLNVSGRKKLIGTTRDLYRNFAPAAWAIRKHLDYTSTFSFQARTGDDSLNRRIEELVAWWSRPKNFDVSGRHSRQRFVRLMEQRRTVDGDMFMLKLASGHVQAIEGDRVRTPSHGAPRNMDRKQYVHGVKVNPVGRPLAYCICKRGLHSGFEYERVVPARHIEPHGFYDRFDQIRGVSPLAAAVNAFRDVYEGMDYALAKMKVSQLFALAFYRDAEEALGDVTGGDSGTDENEDGEDDGDKSSYEVDFGRGPIQLDLDPGDKAEFLESKSPSKEFQAFCQVVIGAALKALDIPYSFYDEGYTNYSGARQALLLYEQSAEIKRQDTRTLLDRLTAWRLGLFIQDGVLVLPEGMRLSGLNWEWIANGIPWIDPLKEMKADETAVNNGLKSRTEISKARGREWNDILDELADEEAKMGERLTTSGVTNAK